MKGTLHLGKRAAAVAVAALWAAALSAASARADDLVTLSGRTFHDVSPVRVEPDGVTWHHATGVCKVDFTDSPKAVRDAYHYDPARAVAYHEAQAQTQRQAEEQTRQLLQANEARQRARAQTEVQAQGQTAAADPGAPATPGGSTFVYRHGLAPTVEAAARSLGEQVDARKAQEASDARASEGLGNPEFWRYVPTVGSKPRPLRDERPNSVEFKSSLYSTGDDFFNPIHMTKSYNDDVDRAAAFARGAPLK